MSNLILGSICLSDIPKEKIKAATNGKKYLNICIAERREPDQYDNTHTIYVSQDKEERDAKTNKCYIGSGRAYNPQPAAATPEAVDQMPPADVDDLDLPF